MGTSVKAARRSVCDTKSHSGQQTHWQGGRSRRHREVYYAPVWHTVCVGAVESYAAVMSFRGGRWGWGWGWWWNTAVVLMGKSWKQESASANINYYIFVIQKISDFWDVTQAQNRLISGKCWFHRKNGVNWWADRKQIMGQVWFGLSFSTWCCNERRSLHLYLPQPTNMAQGCCPVSLMYIWLGVEDPSSVSATAFKCDMLVCRRSIQIIQRFLHIAPPQCLHQSSSLPSEEEDDHHDEGGEVSAARLPSCTYTLPGGADRRLWWATVVRAPSEKTPVA